MSRRKLVVVTLLVVLAVVAGIAIWFVRSIDGIVAREIERAGSEATGTTVSVGGVNVILKQGSGTIRSLRIANPTGFSPAAVLVADGITFDIDLTTLRDEVLVVDEVHLSRPRVRFEISKAGQANLDVIARNAQAAGQEPDTEPRKLRIKRFVIEDAGIDADASAVMGKQETLELKDLVFTNLGGRDGATSDVIAGEIIAAVRKEVSRKVMNEGFRRYLGGSEEDLKGKAKEKLEGLFRK